MKWCFFCHSLELNNKTSNFHNFSKVEKKTNINKQTNGTAFGQKLCIKMVKKKEKE